MSNCQQIVIYGFGSLLQASLPCQPQNVSGLTWYIFKMYSEINTVEIPLSTQAICNALDIQFSLRVVFLQYVQCPLTMFHHS